MLRENAAAYHNGEKRGRRLPGASRHNGRLRAQAPEVRVIYAISGGWIAKFSLAIPDAHCRRCRKLLFNNARQIIELCVYAWHFGRSKLPPAASFPASFITSFTAGAKYAY